MSKPTFKKGLKIVYRCGHERAIPDDFYQRTGMTQERVLTLNKSLDCPKCVGYGPRTYVGVDLLGRAVRKTAIQFPRKGPDDWS